MLSLNELPIATYLVGGWVRDRLINRTSRCIDLDFVLPRKAVETAKAIANKHNAGFVLLDAERQIARVVFPDGTADFAQQMGETIAEDLSRRDFTMNAIAVDCAKISGAKILGIKTQEISQKLPELIDPFGGYQDIQAQRVRMISCQNLKDDPLRIIRAYRQAAQLGFEIEALTRDCLIEFAPDLKNIAAERIRTELSYLLALGVAGTIWIDKAARDGVLNAWIPAKNLMLNRFMQVDRAIAQIIDQWQYLQDRDLQDYFAQILSSDRSVTVIVKLAALSASATALNNLGFSRIEQRWIVNLLRNLPQFMIYLDQEIVLLQDQYQMFTNMGEMFPALTVLAIASGKSLNSIMPWLNRWLNPHDPLAHLIPLLNGDDLKTELGLTAGQKIGDLLNELKLAQVNQIITNRHNAIAFAKTLI